MKFVVSRYILDKGNKVFVQDISPSHSTREQADLKLAQVRKVWPAFGFEVREIHKPPTTAQLEQESFDKSEYQELERRHASGEMSDPDEFRRLCYLRGLEERFRSLKSSEEGGSSTAHLFSLECPR